MVKVGPIEIIERESPPRICLIDETERLFLNPEFNEDWRIRTDIHNRLIKATAILPDGLCFMVYEAFRSRARQHILWDLAYDDLKEKQSNWDANKLYNETSRWVAPPDGFGSGHQAGAAIDITLATTQRQPLDMGTPMQGVTPLTRTDALVSLTIRKNRNILIDALASQGLVNYPEEWWHFCYGDRLWAEITGRDKAFFAPID